MISTEDVKKNVMTDTDSRIVISDVHGCYYTLLELLEKLPYISRVSFVGDLIDRGNFSNQIVQYIINSKSDCCLGNHEKMMLDYCEGVDQSWFSFPENGAKQTVLSYPVNDTLCEISDEHYKFLSELPYYLEYDNLIVSHSYVTKTIKENIKNLGILWNRNTVPKKLHKFHIFGHTPVKEPVIKDYWANIDTGCGKGGKLTALEYPSMKYWQVSENYMDRKCHC
jgi:serine/threonine protein phosphatase 1